MNMMATTAAAHTPVQAMLVRVGDPERAGAGPSAGEMGPVGAGLDVAWGAVPGVPTVGAAFGVTGGSVRSVLERWRMFIRSRSKCLPVPAESAPVIRVPLGGSSGGKESGVQAPHGLAAFS
jgi:hypothetical protein